MFLSMHSAINRLRKSLTSLVRMKVMSYIRIFVSYKLILYQTKVGNPYLMFVVYMNLSFCGNIVSRYAILKITFKA